MAFTTITVTGTYQDANGDPVPGFVTFMLSSQLQDAVTEEIVSRTRIKRYLDSAGSFSVDLVATNDPDTEPLGATYKVSEYIRGRLERVYNIELPYDTPGGTLDLADVAPVTYTELFTYVLTSTFNTHVGTVASTTVLGHVKIDGTTITIDGDGVISSSGGGGGATELDDLTDVVITTPTTGEVLKYNGTEWVNDEDAGGMENPMTSIGDIIIGGVGGTPERLGAGSLQPLVLTQISGVPAWAALNQASGETYKVVFNASGDVALTFDDTIVTARV
jgi:hypothetical protein